MNKGKEIQSWERERIRIWELHKKPNMKRKRSLLRKHAKEKEDENANNSNYSNELPADIMSCIIERCTVNTLSMLKCTSKAWNDFISSPSFVHSHLEHSMKNAHVLFMRAIPPELPRLRRHRLHFVTVDMKGKGESDESYTITIPQFKVTGSGMIASSGLVCILSGHARIYLCNPVTKQLRKLPKCSRNDASSKAGFGYLHSTKEYKVVNFFYRHFQLRCEVFTFTSLTNGQVWKEIAETPPCNPNSRGLLVKECMYWLAKPRVSAVPDRILSFEFKNEKFLTISYPPSVKSLSPLSLMDLKGTFCVPGSENLWKSSILDLWILKDNISCNWVKEYSINLANFVPRHYILPIKAWKEGIIFLSNGKVVFYDLKRRCFRESTIGCGAYQEHDILVYGFEIYQKSLFSL